MKILIKKLLFFVSIYMALLISWVLVLQWVEGDPCHNWETQSSASIIPEDQSYDLLILGSSHGRTFLDFKNQLRVQKILGMRVINLSKIGGAGPLWSRIFLNQFYAQGNVVGRILYFIDPPALFSESWNEGLCFAIMQDEPFRFRTFYDAVKAGVQTKCLVWYLRNYLMMKWTFKDCRKEDINANRLGRVDGMAVKQRIRSLYPEGLDRNLFRGYSQILREIIESVREQGADVVFVLYPTLLGEVPGTEDLKQLLLNFAETYHFEWYDFTTAIKDYSLFSDHDHLNSFGVELFTREYLKPIFHLPPQSERNGLEK